MGLVPENKLQEEIQKEIQDNWEEVLPLRSETPKTRIYAAGERFAERFEIEKLLARGALGITYRARGLADGGLVALKILRRGILAAGREKQRFERFVKLAQGLDHPSHIRIFDYGQVLDEFFVTREFVEGQSLDQLILERKKRPLIAGVKRGGVGTFGLEEVLNLVTEVGNALTQLKDRTFHGSLTPNDIIVTDKRAKIANLALARIFQPAQFSSLQIFFGSGYFYLAPEYDRAGAVIDHRADLYALAVIAYEMLTGEIPRTPVMPLSLVNPSVFAGLDGPFLKALEANPDSRQEDIARFIDQIRGVSGLTEISARPEPVSPSPIKERLSQAIGQQLQTRLESVGAEPPAEKMPVLPLSVPPPGVSKKHETAIFSAPRAEARDSRWHWALIASMLFAVSMLVWVRAKVIFRRPTGMVRQNILRSEPVQNPPGSIGEIGAKGPGNVSNPGAPTKKSGPGPDHAERAPLAAAQVLGFKKNSCPAGMVYVSGGNFVYGTMADDRDLLDLKAHSVKIQDFCIDVFEWPNVMGRLPQIHVRFEEAEANCAGEGKRLCTETEWERACKGSQTTEFPYGMQFTATRCNTKNEHGVPRILTESGRYRSCTNSWGIFDMSGNAAEWTSGSMVRGKRDRIIRGGSFNSSSWAARCSSRKNRLPETSQGDLGFRCCARPKI